MKQNTYQNLTLLVFLRSANWRDELKREELVSHSKQLPQHINSEPQSKIMIGFICVDNLRGGFDDLIAHNFLAAITDLNFIVYSSFDKLKEMSNIK